MTRVRLHVFHKGAAGILLFYGCLVFSKSNTEGSGCSSIVGETTAAAPDEICTTM